MRSELVERAGILPISEPNVSRARRSSTAIDRNTQNDKTNDSCDFDRRKPEFKLAVPPHAKEVGNQYEHILDRYPDGNVY